jgi:4-amino-4-deoxy-L-arabinose transferase-like glycosyltransferase
MGHERAKEAAQPPSRRHWPILAAILLGALALRLWGIRQGLPYAYNSDENAHFVPKAIGMFVLGANPHYFANPPAFTYLLHVVFAVWFGGRGGVSHAFALHPSEVFVVARVTAALLGTLAVWLLYLLGARLFNRGVGLLAAALQAVAFLPVFYAHLALNDVPTLAPLTLSLLGSAGVLRHGRKRDYLLAGVGLGLGCASKYTAGIVVLPLLAAAVTQFLTLQPDAGRRATVGMALAGSSALAAFLLANP